MNYLGGKYRIASKICTFLEEKRQGRVFVEPFCGALNITAGMKSSPPRIANDICEPLINMYRKLIASWVPPEEVSEELYHKYKENPVPEDPLTAFIGFGCSFGGKWFAGYARNSKGENYAARAKRALLKKMVKCQNVDFHSRDYRDFGDILLLGAKQGEIPGRLIYCDPPYQQVTGYDATKSWGPKDYDDFWQTMRQWSKNNSVYISEYIAPDDFETVLEIPVTTSLRDKEDKGIARMENLFTYAG